MNKKPFKNLLYEVQYYYELDRDGYDSVQELSEYWEGEDYLDDVCVEDDDARRNYADLQQDYAKHVWDFIDDFNDVSFKNNVNKTTLTLSFDYLPLEVKLYMFYKQKNAGNPYNISVFRTNLYADASQGGFSWDCIMDDFVHKRYNDTILSYRAEIYLTAKKLAEECYQETLSKDLDDFICGYDCFDPYLGMIEGLFPEFIHLTDFPNRSDKNQLTLKTKKMKNSALDSMIKAYTEQFMPVEDNNVKITMSGELCIAYKDSFVTIEDDGSIVETIKDMCIDIPAFLISKPKNDIKKGDYIKFKDTYGKVLEIEENGLQIVTIDGSEITQRNVKNFFTNNVTFKVVVSPMASVPNMDPMMFAMLDNKMDLEKIMMMQMFSGKKNINFFGNTDGNNIMQSMLMLKALSKDEDSKDNSLVKMFMLSQMFQQNGVKTPTLK